MYICIYLFVIIYLCIYYIICRLITWNGNSLRGNTIFLPEPANFAQWSGGLEGGPLVLFAGSHAAVFGPSNEFKTTVISRVGSRVVAGIQGMVQSVPAGYEVRFALVGSSEGITASTMAYGSLLRKAHGTAQTKLTLADDPLSRQLHFVNDGGSLLNYCDYW